MFAPKPKGRLFGTLHLSGPTALQCWRQAGCNHSGYFWILRELHVLQRSYHVCTVLALSTQRGNVSSTQNKGGFSYLMHKFLNSEALKGTQPVQIPEFASPSLLLRSFQSPILSSISTEPPWLLTLLGLTPVTPSFLCDLIFHVAHEACSGIAVIGSSRHGLFTSAAVPGRRS